jgi:cleavage and polyadenylation specificity factor subunit 4
MVLGLLLREVEEKTLEFDFESFLPDDSVEKENEEANGSVVGTTVGGVTIGMKKDFKRGTVVCRHWLRGLCMKGDNCEFLHQVCMV